MISPRAGGADPAATLRAIMASVDRDPRGASAQARAAVRAYPTFAPAHRVLAFVLRRLGNVAEAECAELQAIKVGLETPGVVEAQEALASGRLHDAEILIRDHLRRDPEDAGAAFILGEIAARSDAAQQAENLFRRAFLLAPAYLEPRVALARMLHGAGRFDEAHTVVDELLARDAMHLTALSLKATILMQRRDLDATKIVFARLTRHHPHDARGWMNFAYLLKTRGDTADSIAAYRTSVGIDPLRGIAWWGLANLKTFRFDQGDVAAMCAALADPTIDDDDRLHLHFALGKALTDLGDDAAAFESYAAGNRLRRAQAPHDTERVDADVCGVARVFTAAFFAARAGQGDPAPDPIFIVSLPRSGSTLVEQILASHPMIEGTEELYDIERIAMSLAPGEPTGGYLEKIEQLSAAELRSLGRQYVAATRRVRRTNRPFFTDKMPSNWVYAGFIHAILPRARIIDVRRHPLGCGFANFAQHFNWGINFSYDLADIGHFYRAYVRQMAHFDAVWPGLVHRVHYENLVEDLQGEVRRMLAYLGLPFDDACLRFFETRREIHTPSAEQVRRPINREGTDLWRRFEPWLDPLKHTLGPILEHYPAVPPDASV